MNDKPNPSNAPLMLSVSGARGIVGKTMTPSVAVDFAAAFGSFIQKKGATICLGRDSRSSGEALAASAAAGLASVGCSVIDLGVVPTPTVGVMILAHQADGGMMITASHNPGQWNGIKFINSEGAAPAANVVQQIITRFKEKDFDLSANDLDGSFSQDDSGNETHVGLVLANIDPEPIRSCGFKVVLDSINGAGCISGRMLLEQLGCEIVHINNTPDGDFAHTPEPIQENLTDLAKITARQSAACGFAQDPDADRLAIVDENGKYIGEEYTLVLAAKRIMDIQGGGPLATNLSTSRMIDDLASNYTGANVIRTAVGEANVATAMRTSNCILGGEGNGGVIYPPVCYIRDSLSSMALVLSLIAAEQKSLSQVVAALPHYEMIKHKFDLTNLGGLEAVSEMIKKVETHFTNEKINNIDGVRVDFTEGWVHLRPSNTEPIVRLIAEAKTKQAAEELMHKVGNVAGLA